MKTVEVHEVEAGYVNRVVVRQVRRPGDLGHAAWEVDLLGVMVLRAGPFPPPEQEVTAVRLTITPQGEGFGVHVNPAISPDLARRV